MIVVKVCVGSSCFLKGAPEIVEMLEKRVSENRLEDEIALIGSFCAGRCNRVGVTIAVDDDVYTCITKENFDKFWEETIMRRVARGNSAVS